MTNKQLGVTVTGDIDDIISKLDDVIGKIQDVPDRTVELGLNVSDTDLDTLKTDLGEIDDKSIAVNVDDSGLSQLAITAADASNSVEAIGDSATYASSDINSSLGAASPAESSLTSLSSNANTASNEIVGTGTSANEAGDEITGSMSDAALTIAAVGAAAELSAQQIYGMSQDIEQLSNYTGLTTDELKEMETSLSSASFPISDIDSYLTSLSQLGVSSDLLEKNAYAMNEIAEGTGASSSAVNQFAKDIKALGGDVSNLANYYGLAGYAQQNVVGGLEGFASYAKTLGPKLTEMGLSAEESTVVIGALSQKYAGNMRGMRSAVTAADGDVNKLYSSLGLTQSSVDSSVGSFDSYSSKLTDTADSARDAHSDLAEFYVSLQDVGIMLGFTGADVLSFTGIVASAVGGPYLFAKALDKLGITANWSGKYIQFLKNSVSTVGDFFKSGGESILNTIKSWMGWGDEAKKATDSVINDITKASPKAEEAGIKFGKALPEGISSGIKSSAVLLDEAGNVLWTDTEGIIKNIGTKGSTLAESTGFRIPSLFGKGFLAGATRAVPDIAAGAIQLIDGLANYTEYLKDPLGSLFGPVKYLIPPQILALNELASPEKIMTALIGPEGTQGFMTWAKIKIEDPMRKALGDTFGDVTSWWNGLVGQVGLNTLQVANTTTDGVTAATNKAASVAESAAAKMRISTENSYAAQIAAAQKYAEAALAAYETATAAAEASWSRMSSMLGEMGISLPGTNYSPGEMLNQRNQTLSDLRNQRNALTQAGTAAFGGSYTKYKNALDDIDRQIKQLSSSSVYSSIAKSGQSVGSTWANGVALGVTSGTSAITNAVGNASVALIANSPPKEGPLSKIDQYGLSIGETFTEYLSRGISSVSDVLGLGSVSLSTPLPSASSVSNISSIGGATFYFTGDIIVPEGSDAVAVGRDLGTGINESLSERLTQQGNSRGVSYVNLNR